MPFFVVVEEQGLNWDAQHPMRKQVGWDEHARFMDALEGERFVVLGGPLRHPAGHRALLVFDAPDESIIRGRLADDPWMQSGILRIREIEQWELLLGRIR